MHTFAYMRARNPADAVKAAVPEHGPATTAQTQFLAGGTTLLDLMKLDAMRPDMLIDINDLREEFSDVDMSDNGLRLGALARMSDVGNNPDVARNYPVIAQALLSAASTQIRNMATLGGNVLQRTRCSYFRDVASNQCNKRIPGSGCAAVAGVNRKHAVLGTSPHCIATYPGDFAQALLTLDAEVEIVGRRSARRIAFDALHVAPGSTPEIETTLAPGELITGFFVPARPWARRSVYRKIRDRESYEFALASAAVALDLDGQLVRDSRVALGGVATRPWRAHEAEAVLKGQKLTAQLAHEAAEQAFAGAVTYGQNDFKPALGRRTLVRALLEASAMEV
jgi:xanthine dehydrogenase YagS FAD-binding subunit